MREALAVATECNGGGLMESRRVWGFPVIETVMIPDGELRLISIAVNNFDGRGKLRQVVLKGVSKMKDEEVTA